MAAQEEILTAVNTATRSCLTLGPRNFTSLLADVTRNSSGHIVSAGATAMQWIGRGGQPDNSTALTGGGFSEQPVSQTVLDWEAQLSRPSTF